MKDTLGYQLRQLLGYTALFPSGMLLFGISFVKCDLELIAGIDDSFIFISVLDRLAII